MMVKIYKDISSKMSPQPTETIHGWASWKSYSSFLIDLNYWKILKKQKTLFIVNKTITALIELVRMRCKDSVDERSSLKSLPPGFDRWTDIYNTEWIIDFILKNSVWKTTYSNDILLERDKKEQRKSRKSIMVRQVTKLEEEEGFRFCLFCF